MYQSTLFDGQQTRPLASRMRPEELDEFAGQQHLLGPGKVLRQMIDQDRVTSMIFWGPPGVGKTTLARIIARRTKAEFIDFIMKQTPLMGLCSEDLSPISRKWGQQSRIGQMKSNMSWSMSAFHMSIRLTVLMAVFVVRSWYPQMRLTNIFGNLSWTI